MVYFLKMEIPFSKMIPGPSYVTVVKVTDRFSGLRPKKFFMFPPGARVSFFRSPGRTNTVTFHFSILLPELLNIIPHYALSSLLLLFRQEGFSVFSREDFSFSDKDHTHIYMFTMNNE